jgi:NitT/TauT family transport system substrate-binding protein
MQFGSLRWASLLFVGVFLLFSHPATSAEKPSKIRFGTLPVLQALPLYVAQDKGFYGREGLDVELIPFNTAAEKDIALAAGSIDGYFGDLLTPIVLRGNGRDVFIVVTNYDTRYDRRMFAVLGKPGSSYKAIGDLVSVPVAISSNTVIDYVTERLLLSGGVPPDKCASVETKNIGMRMQMLLSGQVEAATLPEPLVTAAVGKGATVLADDAGMATSQTVLVLSGSFLKEHAAAVKAFLKTQREAAALINAQPDTVRPIMVEHVRLPEPLKAVYPVPRFPEPRAPDKEAVATIGQWLVKRDVIKTAPIYEQVVDVRFIP